MRNALWAEWIIARFADRNRAAAIVGDLLETATQRGTLWFCLSVAEVVLSLTWRRTVAFVAAFYVGLFWQREFIILMFIRAGHPGPRLNPWDPWEPLFSVVWFGAVLWMAAAYAAIRYGLRDKFVQVTLGFCGLITIEMCYWRIPVVTAACVALALSILAASVRSARRSRALVALTAALVFGFGGGLLSFYLRAALENLLHFSLARSDLDRTIVNVGFWFLAAWITTTACARMHGRLLRRDQRGREIASPT